jgi:uncharacterized protein YndB with AHSA1/START domain
MTVTDTTDRTQGESLSMEFDLPHAPAKVWRALTEPALLSQWLLPVVGLRLEPGTAFALQAPPQPGWDGTVNCTLLDLEPVRSIRYAWVVGEIDTIVTFTLVPTESGTRLSLVQSGFKPQQKQNFGGARYGWKMMGGRLVDLLARTA